MTEEQQRLLEARGAVPVVGGQAPPLPSNSVGVIQVALVATPEGGVEVQMQSSLNNPAQIAWFLDLARDMVKAGAMTPTKPRPGVVLASGQVPRV